MSDKIEALEQQIALLEFEVVRRDLKIQQLEDKLNSIRKLSRLVNSIKGSY